MQSRVVRCPARKSPAACNPPIPRWRHLAVVSLAALLVPCLARGGGAEEPAQKPEDTAGPGDASDALDRALQEARAGQSPKGEAATPPAAEAAGKTGGAPDALDRALAATGPAAPPAAPTLPPAPAPATSDLYSKQFGAANLRFINLGVDLLFAVGSSTATDDELQSLQGGGHDPRKRGFTLQNLELSFYGAVDPFFTADVHLIFYIDPVEGESEFELEEAFLTTQCLPWGFQLEAGQIMTEFGRINPQHPHQWDWLDVPVVNARFFGPDGMRNPGFRLGWLSPLPWFLELSGGMQNANGETMASFLSSDELWEDRPITGGPYIERDVKTFEDLLYLVRLDNGFDITDELGAKAGASLVYGPNATGSEGFTRIYGADLLLKWRPLDSRRGWPFITFQSEIMKRDYFADGAVDPGPDPDDPADDVVLPSALLGDWGVYAQLLWGFREDWAVGCRYEYAGPLGSAGDPQDDPFRDTRHRVSPMMLYRLTEFSRVRLQYNYDHAMSLPSHEASSVWLGVEVLFGAHAAHAY